MSRAGNEARRRYAILRALPATLWPGEWRLQPLGGDAYAIVHATGPAEGMRVGQEVVGLPSALGLSDDVPTTSLVSLVGEVRVRPGHGGLREACQTAFEVGLAYLVCEL